MPSKKGQSMQGIQGRKNVRVTYDLRQASDRDHAEPDQHDRTEQDRDLAGAARLHRK